MDLGNRSTTVLAIIAPRPSRPGYKSTGGGYLVGWITKHPWEPGRKLQSNTSGIIVADSDLRRVRTIGRFYELGAASGSEHAEPLRGMRAI